MAATISFVSLGCDKNTVDSEIMISLLLEHGYTLVKDDALADVIIVNTCGFIQDAKEESIQTIIEMGGYKENGQCKKLVVTGCLAQRYAKEIQEDLPEVDAVVGTGSYERIVEVVNQLMGQDVDEALVKIEETVVKTNKVNEVRSSVVDSVQSLSAIAQENAASSQETSASVTEISSIVSEIATNASELKDISHRLDESMAMFEL